MKELVIIGAGGFGREVADTIHTINQEAARYRLLGFIDDGVAAGTVVNDLPVLGDRLWLKERAQKQETAAVLAIANAGIKRQLVDDLKDCVEWETIVHPTALVSPYASVGRGSVLQAYSLVSANCVVGHSCMLNTFSSMGHDAQIEDYVSVMSHCDITGGVCVGSGAFLGSGARVIPGFTIGENAVIGAGAVVFGNVASGATAVGNPARVIRK